MGPGFYLMFATAILIHRVAEADGKTGWIWFGVNLCVSMLLGQLFGLTVIIGLIGFALTFGLMFLHNLLRSSH